MSTSVDSHDLYDLYRDLDARLARERYAELDSGPAPKREDETRYSLSQWQLMWRKFVRNRAALVGGIVIVSLYVVALFGNFVAPQRAWPVHLGNKCLKDWGAGWNF